jgi:hypothetical protein
MAHRRSEKHIADRSTTACGLLLAVEVVDATRTFQPLPAGKTRAKVLLARAQEEQVDRTHKPVPVRRRTGQAPKVQQRVVTAAGHS